MSFAFTGRLLRFFNLRDIAHGRIKADVVSKIGQGSTTLRVSLHEIQILNFRAHEDAY
jgi:hypothetical protein